MLVEAAAADEATPEVSSGSGRELDLIVATAAFLVLVGYAPNLDQAPTTLRFLVVAPVGAVGLVVLARLAVLRDAAARWALGYLAWAALATALSDNVRQSLVPGFGTDRGWLAVALFIGWYAVGRRRGAAGELLLVGGLMAGLVLNALLAIAQYVVRGDGLLALSEGRSIGFAPSSVYLGTLLAGALPFAAWLAGHRGRTWWAWVGVVVVFSAATDASGSRSGLIIGALASLWVVRRCGWRRLGAVAAAIVVGLLVLVPFSSPASSTNRLAEGGGMTPRLIMWEITAQKAAERPLTGWGPNRYLNVTAPEIPARFARLEGPEKLYFDAHNIVLEQLLGTGLPGVVLLGGFAVVAGRRARGPLACFAAGAALTWLLEPASIASAPLVLLALGAAGTQAAPPPPRWWWKAGAVAMALLAAVGAGRLLLADAQVYQSKADGTLDGLAEARRLVPDDPALSDVDTQFLKVFARTDPDRYTARARAAARRTIRLEPDQPEWWYRLAQIEFEVARGPEREKALRARAALRRAYRLNPWSEQTLDGLAVVSKALGDTEAAERWEAKRCQVVDCDAG